MVVSIEPYNTKKFLNYLRERKWSAIHRSVKIADNYVDIVATSPYGDVYGFRFLNCYKDIPKELIEEAWRRGLVDLYYYALNAQKLEYEVSITRWVGVFICVEETDIKLAIEEENKNFGLWYYFPEELHIINNAKDISISMEIAIDRYLETAFGKEERNAINKEKTEEQKEEIVELTNKALNRDRLFKIEI